MSHNRIKVGTAEPDAFGAISPSLTSDFGLTSVSDGKVIGYTTVGGWSGVPTPSIGQRIFYSYQSITSYSSSAYYYAVNDNLIWMNYGHAIDDTTYVTRQSASGTTSPVTNTNWTMSWRLLSSALQGKKIICEAVHMGRECTGTEQLTYQWAVGTSSSLATSTPIGNRAQQNQYYCQTAYGHLEVGASDVYIALKVVSETGNISIQNYTASLNSYVTIGIIEE